MDNIEKPLFLMLGDSLVAGHNWQPYFQDYTLRNFGVPGATSQDLLDSLETLRSCIGKTKLILVMIGTNDLAMEHYGFLQEYETILRFLRHTFPDAEILATSILPMHLYHLSQDTIVRINDLLRSSCQANDTHYFDLHPHFLKAGNGLFQADGVHLSEKGYQLWAQTLMERIAFIVDND